MDARKIFVGGLGGETTEADMTAYFSQFGTVEHSQVKRDFATSRSRGFGFVTFQDAGSIDKLLAVNDHYIKGKRVDPKRVETQPGGVSAKIFVGGIDTNLSENQVRDEFMKYGKVAKVEWPADRMRGGKKNFVFVEFENAETVTNLLKQGDKCKVGDRMCDLRRYTSANRLSSVRPGSVPANYNNHHQFNNLFLAQRSVSPFPVGMMSPHHHHPQAVSAGFMPHPSVPPSPYNNNHAMSPSNLAFMAQQYAAAAATAAMYGVSPNMRPGSSSSNSSSHKLVGPTQLAPHLAAAAAAAAAAAQQPAMMMHHQPPTAAAGVLTPQMQTAQVQAAAAAAATATAHMLNMQYAQQQFAWQQQQQQQSNLYSGGGSPGVVAAYNSAAAHRMGAHTPQRMNMSGASSSSSSSQHKVVPPHMMVNSSSNNGSATAYGQQQLLAEQQHQQAVQQYAAAMNSGAYAAAAATTTAGYSNYGQDGSLTAPADQYAGYANYGTSQQQQQYYADGSGASSSSFSSTSMPPPPPPPPYMPTTTNDMQQQQQQHSAYQQQQTMRQQPNGGTSLTSATG